MSYDNPSKKETYVLPSAAFGATSEALAIKGPKGKTGLVKDIRNYVTANMVGTTTVPEINVGSAASVVGTLLTEYARHRLGTTAILGNTAAGTPYRARALAAGKANNAGGLPPTLDDFTGHVALETAKIPADTVVYISRVAGSGGTPAGTASTEVDIEWD